MTGVADAFMDSVPMVVVTGQVPQDMIGRGAFQKQVFRHDAFGGEAQLPRDGHRGHPPDHQRGVSHRRDGTSRAGGGGHPEEYPDAARAADLPEGDRVPRLLRGSEGRRRRSERDDRDDHDGRAADDLLRRRGDLGQRVGGTPRVRRAGADPGGDDAHGHRQLSREPPVVAEVARDARDGLREQRGQRGGHPAGDRGAV